MTQIYERKPATIRMNSDEELHVNIGGEQFTEKPESWLEAMKILKLLKEWCPEFDGMADHLEGYFVSFDEFHEKIVQCGEGDRSYGEHPFEIIGQIVDDLNDLKNGRRDVAKEVT